MTNKEKIVQLILLNGGFVVAVILIAVLVAIIFASICALFSDNIQTIQIVTVVAVWLAEIALIIVRSKIAIGLKLKATPIELKAQIRKQEVKRTIIAGIVFVISLGIVLYGILNGMSKGVEANYTSSLKFKITICILLTIYLIARYYIRKSNKKQ